LGLERVERRLAAILAADVVGYARLMGADEEGTHAALRETLREVGNPKITEHRGRIVKTTGDGLLVEFPSVVYAVRCGIDVQRAMAERNAATPVDRRIEFRVGVHQGDIIFEDGDIFGDGVNLAARLESLAEPGGICISDRVHADVVGKVDVDFIDLGEQSVKNIAQPVRAFAIRIGADPATVSISAKPALALPDKPSIAVLPFRSLSTGEGNNLVGEGLLEDLIETLSRIPALFVISRLSALAFRNHEDPPREIGKLLGVRYVLSGSIRVAANRLRLTVELIDAHAGTALWVSRIDERILDLIEVQERLAYAIVRYVGLHVHAAEIKRTRTKRTDDLNAYDLFLRAQEHMHNSSRAVFDTSERLFDEAIARDPDYATALAWRAYWHVLRVGQGWSPDMARDTAQAEYFARRALDCDNLEPMAFAVYGHIVSYLHKDFELAFQNFAAALDINPNSAQAWSWSALTRAWLGDGKRAIEEINKTIALSPYDPLMYAYSGIAAMAHLAAGKYDLAIEYALRSVRENKTYTSAYRLLAIASQLAGKAEQARRTVHHLLQLEPGLTVAKFRQRHPSAAPQTELYCDALARAGLPPF
jgi:class 3 adenylate cyclase/TolB-like protein